MNLKTKSILLLLLILFSCNKGQNENYKGFNIQDSIINYNKRIKSDKDPDSLKKDLVRKVFEFNSTLKNDSIRIKNNDTIAFNYFKLNLFNDYHNIIKLNLKDSYNSKDTLRIIKSNTNYGYYYLRRNIYDSAFYYFDKSQKLYVVNNMLDLSNDLSIEKASIQYYKGDYLGSEATILKSLSFFKTLNDPVKLNIAYTGIGLCKIELKEYDDAIVYLKLALELSKGLNEEKSFDIIALYNLSLVYFRKEDYKKAIEYYEKILKYEKIKSKNLQVYTFTKQHLFFSKFKLGYTVDLENEYVEIIKGYEELNLSPIQVLTELSEFYESKDNIQKAQEYALKSYVISNKEKLYREKLIALKQLTNVFPEKAKYYSNEYIKLSDSIAAVDKKTQNTFARIEYRVDELNSENLLLAERNKQIIYFSVIVLLLVSMYYFYKWQKQKQLELLLIQEQQIANEQVYSLLIDQQAQMDKVKVQEQKRISQELHDGVLGKLFGARMNLDFINNQQSDEIKKDKQKYINEIIEVERQIRQISHELNDDKIAIINNFQLLLDKLVDDQESILNLKIDYSINTKVPWDMFTAEEKINIYRIIQESFQNIYKYSRAEKVSILLIYYNSKLKISILDDGKGFNTLKNSKGIGIKNMKDRAKSINAIYDIESQLNEGTKTQIILEINPNKEF